MNITLIGMPGCGKSTCGILAAKILCKSFLDTDLLIQENEGMKLQEIIDKKGDEYFAKAEENAIVTLYTRNCVIATGGSVVYSAKSMAHLKDESVVIYLKISYQSMKSRIKNLASRGILLKDGKTLLDMYNERVPLYEKYADITVECDSNAIEATVETICEKIDEYRKKHPEVENNDIQ